MNNSRIHWVQWFSNENSKFMIFPLWKSHAEGLHSSLCTGPNRFHALWPNGRRWAYRIVLDSWILSLSGKARAARQHDVAFTSCCWCPQLEGEAFYAERIRSIDYSHRLGVAFLMLMLFLEIKIMGAWSLSMGRPFFGIASQATHQCCECLNWIMLQCWCCFHAAVIKKHHPFWGHGYSSVLTQAWNWSCTYFMTLQTCLKILNFRIMILLCQFLEVIHLLLVSLAYIL